MPFDDKHFNARQRFTSGTGHLVGIGGAGMSVIAEIMHSQGIRVQGSDRQESAVTEHLRARGINVFVGHKTEQIQGADYLVVSSAIKADNPEYFRAQELGLEILHRSQALAFLTETKRLIAVAGAHGKTTTSGMLASALLHLELDPSFALGADLVSDGVSLPGGRSGGGKMFVIEADESDGSFLNYVPDVALITNIEADHLDNHKDSSAIDDLFLHFVGRIASGGVLVCCGDDSGVQRLLRNELPVQTTTYGFEHSNDYVIEQVSSLENTFGSAFELVTTDALGEERYQIQINVPGIHNVLNAAGAFVALLRVGVSGRDAALALASFNGAKRRFDLKRQGDLTVIDDYAHHPTEVDAFLKAVELHFPGRRKIAVFQPHLYSRTQAFKNEFATALAAAEIVILDEIYAAREIADGTVTSQLIVDLVNKISPGKASYVPGAEKILAHLASQVQPGDVVLSIGAGDITALSDLIAERIKL